MVSSKLRKRARALTKPPSKSFVLRKRYHRRAPTFPSASHRSSVQREIPPSLPDLHVTAANAAAPSSTLSNPLQNLAPGVGGGNPLQFFLQLSSAPTGATPLGPSISQAGEPSVDHQQPPQLVDGSILERQPFPPLTTSPTPDAVFSADITAIASADINLAPVIVRHVLPVLPVLPALSAAVLPAIPVQTDSQLSLTLDSNVMNSNIQSVATFAIIVNATNDVGGVIVPGPGSRYYHTRYIANLIMQYFGTNKQGDHGDHTLAELFVKVPFHYSLNSDEEELSTYMAYKELVSNYVRTRRLTPT